MMKVRVKLEFSITYLKIGLFQSFQNITDVKKELVHGHNIRNITIQKKGLKIDFNVRIQTAKGVLNGI